MKKRLNQNLINLIEYYSLTGTNLFLSETPIKRIYTKSNMYSLFNIPNCDSNRI